MSVPTYTLSSHNADAFNSFFKAKLKEVQDTTIKDIAEFKVKRTTERYPRFGIPDKDVEQLVQLANNILYCFDELKNAFQTYYVAMRNETFASQNLRIMLTMLQNMFDNFDITYDHFISKKLILQKLTSHQGTLSEIPEIMRDQMKLITL